MGTFLQNFQQQMQPQGQQNLLSSFGNDPLLAQLIAKRRQEDMGGQVVAPIQAAPVQAAPVQQQQGDNGMGSLLSMFAKLFMS